MSDSDIDKLEALEEYEVFLLLLTLTKVNGQMEMEYFEHPKPTQEMVQELIRVRNSISLAISLLEKFGVSDLANRDGTVSFSPLAVQWFDRWKAWFDQMEARGNLETFTTLLKAGADITSWLPENDYAPCYKNTSSTAASGQEETG